MIGFSCPGMSAAALRPVTVLLERRYYVDDVFLALYRALYLGLSSAVGWFDRYVVDGVVNFVTWLTYVIAVRLRATQTGRIQDALYGLAIGFLLLACLAWWG